MTNHPGDYHSTLILAELRRAEIARTAAGRAPATIRRPRLRGGVAAFLRGLADRVDSRAPTNEPAAARRYQRVP